jgi:hypothetical protein
VFESPVRSGLLSKFGKTETETGLYRLMDRKKPHLTDTDRFSAVFVGFWRFEDWLRPVVVLTGYGLVLDRFADI